MKDSSQFNAVNNITQMIDNAGAHNYSYDSLDRLTAATHPNQPNESYTLDDVSNRTASHQGSSYSYQPFNRLVTANGTTFGYNTNGNLISKTDASGSWTYTWDFENRLKQASKSGGVTVTYSFDAIGRRVQRTSSASGTTKFIYDGADVVRDLDGTNATIADYLNGPGVDNKLRQTISGTASYFLTEHLGSTRALADASGSVTSGIEYDSFGNVTNGSPPNRYTYTGREMDSELGLMYYRARWYSLPQGKFLSEDPIGLFGGINSYSYVSNNPLNLSDPYGLRELEELPGEQMPQNHLAQRNKAWLDYFAEDLLFGPIAPRGKCKSWPERWKQSFYETNAFIPGLVAPTLSGMITRKSMAEATGTSTIKDFARSIISNRAVPAGAARTITGIVGASALNWLSVGAAWEGGVAVGSAINASFPTSWCECQ